MIRLLCGALLGLLLLGAPPALAASLPLALIVDSSGSMAADIDGEARLDIARRVILDQAAQWAGDYDLALVAYGHRRQGDCADIQTLLPVAPVDLDRLGTALDQLRARGKTPLSASLIAAAELLPDGGAIILVSDGLETCDADPCAVATALHATNIHVTIHVVGFGLTEAEQKALACIADNGGGLMVSADSAQTLSDALASVGQAAIAAQPAEPEPAAVEPQPLPVEPEPAPIEVPPPTPMPVGFLAMTSAGALPAPVAWTVTSVDGGAQVYDGAGQGIALDLLPGRYRIALTGNNISGGADLDVTSPSETPLSVPIEAGYLQAHLRAGGEMSLADADLPNAVDWTVTPLDGQAAVTQSTGLDPSAVLAPGRYRVAAEIGTHAAETEVQVDVGGTTTADLNLALGRLNMELLAGPEGAAMEGTDLSWRVTPQAGGDPIQIAASAQPTLILPAGDYTVTAMLDGAELSTTASVTEGQATLASISLTAGTVTLEGTLGPDGPLIEDWRNAVWTVIPLKVIGNAAPALQDQAEARPVLTLLPGEWQATLKSGSAITTQTFTVAPGGEQTIRLVQDAAMLRLTGFLVAGGEAFSDWRDVLWTLKSADGTTTLLDASPDLAPSLVVPSGDWIVTLVSGGARLDQPVSLAAGENLSLDIVLDAGRLALSLPEGTIATLDISALDVSGNPLTPPLIATTVTSSFATVLPPGHYLVKATTTTGAYASAPFELAPGQTQSLPLTFP